MQATGTAKALCCVQEQWVRRGVTLSAGIPMHPKEEAGLFTQQGEEE